MPISMTYKELYQSLFDAHVVSPFYQKSLQPSYPKWYDSNAQCDYHAGIMGHSIENYTTFKKLVERFIKMGIVKFDDSSKPDHFDETVNAIIEGGDKKSSYTWGIDIIGPISSKASSRHRFIIVVVICFTKRVEVVTNEECQKESCITVQCPSYTKGFQRKENAKLGRTYVGSVLEEH
ncbi:hypothetical protein EPI10_022841 [Gossypium australe]|uniref:Uncharacterized protein n=1 Tax=Gossypium australe TaxID=47621 RepID=A0A5B6VTQ1_9ROSI|nr:hypothetical protein EPI10_022841 [Gossypium australe]